MIATGVWPMNGFRASLYRLLWNSAELVGDGQAGNALLFIAAGLLRRNELETASREQSREFNVSAEDVDKGLEEDERHVYGTCLQPGDRILLVGCGTGRELL